MARLSVPPFLLTACLFLCSLCRLTACRLQTPPKELHLVGEVDTDFLLDGVFNLGHRPDTLAFHQCPSVACPRPVSHGHRVGQRVESNAVNRTFCEDGMFRICHVCDGSRVRLCLMGGWCYQGMEFEIVF